MSYCVNCGVKLAQAEGKCPLCNTIVHNPNEAYDPKLPKAFPVRTHEQNITINKRYFVLLVLVALGLPAIICMLLDLLVGNGLTWSLYPAGALALIGIGIIVPMVLNKHQAYYAIAIDGGALCLYLFMVEQISSNPGWFLPLAFPLILLTDLMILATVGSIQIGICKSLHIPAVIFLEVAILALGVELLCGSFIHHTLVLSWSPYVMISCGLVSLVLFLIQGNKPLREELQRRLHL